MVEAAQDLFVPVAIYNNVKGPDAHVLKRFGEPAWNNPVFRFVDADGKDLLPRRDGLYSTASVISRMVEALAAARREVPEYLSLARQEYCPAGREKAVFAMYCYWEGEKLLGALEGVIATAIGMHGRYEVVEVEFDPSRVSFAELLHQARTLKCAGRVFCRTDEQFDEAQLLVGDDAIRSDQAVDTSTTQQKHLSAKPELYYLPLTRLQATRMNSAAASRLDPRRFLSPGQIRLAGEIAAALKEDGKFLEGLAPDRSPTGLGAYASALRERLGRCESEF